MVAVVRKQTTLGLSKITVVETRDHLKNGAPPKSQTSREIEVNKNEKQSNHNYCNSFNNFNRKLFWIYYGWKH